MSQPLSVVLIHRDEGERSQLRAALEAIPGVTIATERADLRAGLALARQTPPAILVVDLPARGAETLTAVSQYTLEQPDVAVFFATESLEPELLLKALRAGAQEVLRRPLDRAALRQAVERVAAQVAKKSDAGAPCRAVFSVFSGKGGCGVSTVAANLGISLHRLTGREAVLADLDYHSGDAAFMLGLTPTRSLGDVLAAPSLDSASVQAGLLQHASGVFVLPQPEHLDRLDGLTPRQVGSVLEILSSTFDLVVVDTPHVLNEITLEVFDRSSSVLLIVEPSIPSVRAARRTLEVFHKLNYTATPDRVRLVVNRHSRQSAISDEQIAETLQYPVFHHVANDYAAVSMAINVGKPLCSHQAESPAARDIAALALKLLPGEPAEPAPAEPARRGGRRLFFRRG